MYIDIHTHKPEKYKHASNTIAIENIIYPNHTDMNPVNYYSCGIHPWYIDINIPKSIIELEKLIIKKNLIAIGECGLDRLKSGFNSNQISIFEAQILLSEKHKIPIIIHNVRATYEILHLRKKLNCSQTWIFHGFRGSKELYAQVLKNNCYISINKSFFNNHKHNYTINVNRLFFETDEEHYHVKDVYNIFALKTNTEIKQLQESILKNFNKVFKK